MAATLVANAIAPGPLDLCLARSGVNSQQTDQPDDRTEPFNLWDPVDDGQRGGDHSAHGHFDARSKSRSCQLWMSHHRRGLAAGAPAAAGVLTAAARRS